MPNLGMQILSNKITLDSAYLWGFISSINSKRMFSNYNGILDELGKAKENFVTDISSFIW